MNIKFKITRFVKAIAFQMLETDSTFWAKIAVVIPSLSYTATNGTTVLISPTASSITELKTNNRFTISQAVNLTTVTLLTDAERDTYFNKLLSAIHEFVVYINNNGTLPQVCKYCFNYVGSQTKFCNWVVEVNSNWSIDVDKCANFGFFYDRGVVREVYTI